ncbi:MAG: helix-turn-helix transcriptional regulator [Bacteroidales bacterium]|nr:helix-turn-helix transcriptional regulator [Bacteroidales bacterium]
MKTKAEQIAFLREHSSETPSKWREKAEWRRQNIGWISYSRNIAIKVAMAMNEQNLTQRQLAERMNCSPQYVSRLLKGEENLSLETICKLEVALNICILSNAFAK